MSDEISSPLLSLIRENGLIDDLQYEEVAGEIKRSAASAIHCLPVALVNGALQVALAEPLDPNTASEIGFAAKRDVQIVVADPAEILKGIERFYGKTNF